MPKMKKPRNVRLMYWSYLIGGMLFFLPVAALYYEESLFSITNVAIIFAVESFCVVLFEVPSGALADLFGRKRVIVLGNAMALLALIFLAVGGTLLMFILYAVVVSFARSLVSGADSALIYDSLKVRGREKEYEKTIGTFYALWAVGAMVGSFAGGHMAASDLRSPVLWSFVPLAAATIITLFLREPDYHRAEHKNAFRLMREAAQHVVSRRNLLLVFAAGFIIVGFSENLLMMSSLFFEFKGIAIQEIGYIVAVVLALVALGEFYGYEVAKKFGRKRALLLIGTGVTALTVAGTYAPSYGAAVLVSIPALLHGFRHTIVNGLINEGIDSSMRATMVSLWSFTVELGLAVAAPFIGWMADWYDINTAFRISGAITLIAPVLYYFLRIKKAA